MNALAQVPFVDLSCQWREIRDTVLPDIDALFASSAFVLGPWVERFEHEIADYLGVGHAIGVGSGTTALHLAFTAAGIGRGDKVLVPAHTFIGSIWGLLYLGAEPVLCDVEPGTGLLDLADAARRIGPGVRAILPVHLYGQAMDMDAVRAFAGEHRLLVVEDAAQAIGARHAGRRVGGIGDLGCFSFYPGKNLGAAGEAGLVVTDDGAMARRLRTLRNHAQTESYVHGELGFNARMDAIQALVLSHKLPHLERWTGQRRALAARYSAAFADLPLTLPAAGPGTHDEGHVVHLFVIRTPERDGLRDHLSRSGIQTGLHYPVPLHRQPCLHALGLDRESFPVADAFAREGLSLPLFAGMSETQQDRVIAAVRHFFDRTAA